MNIPARYCTGYLGDIGVPIDPNPMDFSGWAEAFLDGRWYTGDAPAQPFPASAVLSWAAGRDAADVTGINRLWDRHGCAFEVVFREPAMKA